MPKVLTPTGAAKVQRQDFIPVIPRARVWRSTQQTIGTSTQTAVTFDQEDFDTDLIHDPATNPGRLTAKTAGVYRVYGVISFIPNATGSRYVTIRKNGTTNLVEHQAGTFAVTYGFNRMPVSTDVEMGIGDYLEILAYQDTGGNLDVQSGASLTNFGMTYIGPGFNASRAAKQVFYVTPTQFAALAPIDGDEAYLAVDVSNGVIWHLRYNAGSASAYKWEFLGGPPMFSEVATQESYSGSGAYVDLTTVGPSIALPRGGDYDVEIGAFMQATPGASAMRMSYAIGATAASDNDAVWVNMPSGSSVSPARPRRKTGLTAVTLTAKYLAGLNSTQFQNRWMSVRPARIS